MKILIDLQGAQNGSRGRGIGRYSLDLARGIVRNAGPHQVVVLVSKLFPDNVEDVRAKMLEISQQVVVLEMESPAPIGEVHAENWHRIRAAELVREDFINSLDIDVVLICSLMEGAADNTVASIGYLPARAPTAVVLYDLIPLFDEELYLGWKPIKDWYYRKLESMRRANLLLAISKSAAAEATSHLGVQPRMIRTIGSAADDRFVPGKLNPQASRTLAELGVTGKYLMHASAFDRRKNFEGLLEAFSLLPPDLQQSLQLVLVTKPSQDALTAFSQLASKLGVRPEKFILTGHIPDETLVILYQNASLLVFPSFHEGFGLPVLEAMRCGCPVIGSNLSSIPEVIERADSLFDPGQPAQIAGAITRVFTEPGRIETLKAHSIEQAKKFSWDLTAKAAISALVDLAQAGHGQLASMAAGYKVEEKVIPALSDVLKGHPTDLALISEVACALVENRKTSARFNASTASTPPLNWRIEGPFDSTYSLALLNRETARALSSLGHHVVLHSTEGPGDFEPDRQFLDGNPDLLEMNRRVSSYPHSSVNVVSRNLYPPRVADMESACNFLHHYAWEESGFPSQWVDDFNSNLQGITCLSNHVAKILIDNGVTVPLTVSGAGIDHWDRIEPAPDFVVPGKGFRFLHVSSCFPRKGVDALLRSYGRAFSRADNVTLVIKTFQNPHNQIHQWLRAEQDLNPHFPEVVIIEGDLSDEQLKSLYQGCDVLVGPSRAEGFGLPFGEAMLSGLPVITTNWGGQLDFCTPASCWMVDYKFVPAESHFNLPNSVWAEPSERSLTRALLQAYGTDFAKRKQMAAMGARVLRSRFTWLDVSARTVLAARDSFTQHSRKTPVRFGWVTTWNTKCGIATYSDCLISRFPSDVTIFAPTATELVGEDRANVKRCWKQGKEHNDFAAFDAAVMDSGVNTLVIQFNYGFFNFDDFCRLVLQLIDRGMTIILVMHSTVDPPLGVLWSLDVLLPALRKCHRLLVHSRHDLNRLKERGLVENVAIYPHGILLPERVSNPTELPSQREFVPLSIRIVTYGFCLPSKGFIELLRACAILKGRVNSLRLRFVTAEYPDPASSAYIREIKDEVNFLGLENQVELITDFLPVERSLELISEYDLVVFPYRETGESASGAVRHGIASGRPVMVTPIPIFDDLGSAVFRSTGSSAEEMAASLWDFVQKAAIQSPELTELKAKSDAWRRAHDYRHTSSLLYRIGFALHQDNARFSRRWLGSSRELKTVVGVVEGGSMMPTKREGVLLFGPYVRLPAGSYRCVIDLSQPIEYPAQMSIEVACTSGVTVLAQWRAGPVYSSSHDRTVTFMFSNPGDVPDFEFRVWVNKSCKSSVEAVAVEPVFH